MALTVPARTVVLDSEAVSALAARRPDMTARMVAAARGDHRVVVPAVVLTEVMTGGAGDAAVWHVAGRLPVVDIDARLAASGGALRARAGVGRRKKRDLTVDAIVAAVAARTAPSVVLTADPGDFTLLLDGHDVTVSPV
jgi:predicted nucleic acid-binding protein